MIEYDPMKNEEHLATHGLPLEFAELVFDGPFVEEEDRRRDYGETRFIATGPIMVFDDRIFVVVYVWREGVRRIVSFRKANDREVRKYRSNIA